MLKKLCVLGIIFVLNGCFDMQPPSTNALVYTEPRALKPFKISDQNNVELNNQSLNGNWNFIFLGYINCPDICPMTLTKLKKLYASVEKEYPVKVWFISVDPLRDVVSKRKQYIDYFDPDFIAATAPHTQLYPFVRDLGLVYAISQGKIDEDYPVDHSASVALVDEKGKLRAIFKPEFEIGKPPTINTEQMIKEFKLIADYY